MKCLLLRFDAPLISFGAPMVDQYGVVQRFPALSMLTGLFGNALGWDHRDTGLLTELQDRVRYAARIDRRGEAIVDYQTVDLGKPWMLPEKAGWTTAGRIAVRGGGSSEGTHIRFRHYWADSVHTVAVALVDDRTPTIGDIATALQSPARPLFLGRKTCLPATPIFHGLVEAPSLLVALSVETRVARGDDGPLAATWWVDDGAKEVEAGRSTNGKGAALHESAVGGGLGARFVAVTDERDWKNQVHVGRRTMIEGMIDVDSSGDPR
ncbi:MAG: type I-E CRISPR-associated protein Cas5/CasD [Deltaproteobacteria bacterium]|nr:type I-E CRISPR-associated protein Cas5/CasD [Deltaproteobacteria bacterium]